MAAQEMLDELVALQRSYSFTFRAMVTEERYKIVQNGTLQDYTFDTEIIREPLIEHVGHLPIIASYLHPKIEHSKDVNLGRTLIMLSIHDIGETVVGDMLTYSKTTSHGNKELRAAKNLLPDTLLAYLEEMEAQKTLDAKFAHSVDKLAPILHDMTLSPSVLQKRFSHHNFNIDKIIAKKTPYHEWDSVLHDLFAAMTEKYREMEKSWAS